MNRHQLTRQATTPAAQERPKRLLRFRRPSNPIQAAADETQLLHRLERAGESEWTPWIALAGLIVFLVALGLLMFGIVEIGSDVLASAPVAA